MSRLNSKPSTYTELSDDDRQYLSEYFRGDIAFVENCLGRKIDSWNHAATAASD